MTEGEASGTEDRCINMSADLIRSVAIILVIILHAAIEPTPNIDIMSPQGIELWWVSNSYDSISRTAIPLFVMLTGALLLSPSKVDEPLRVFFKKRWKRVGLAVLFWGSIYFIWDFTVKGKAFSGVAILNGILAGPYVHFWYVYVLIGLYLITPLLRVIVAHANWSIIRYFLILWFVGTGIIPLLRLYVPINSASAWFRDSIFVLTGLIGYFVLGAYTDRLKFRRSTLALMLVVGFIATIAGTYFLVGSLGENYSKFLFDSSNFSVIIASIGLFLLLSSVPNKTIITRFPHVYRALQVISHNSLPIYLFHMIVLESLQKGYLGFKISVTTINPIIEVPIITVVTLAICLAIIVPIKKIPYMKRVLG